MILEILAVAPGPLDEWNTAARDNLPLYVKIWLGLMMANNIAAIFFLKNHVAARWVFAGFVVSHLLVAVGFWGTGTPVFAGQVSLFHVIFWTPGMIALWRHRDDIKWPSAFAVWATLVCVFYFASMMIDVPDAITYLAHAIS
ncbi:MAG: hypothetical protein ABJN35_06985 [Erythrobacter sp.]